MKRIFQALFLVGAASVIFSAGLSAKGAQATDQSIKTNCIDGVSALSANGGGSGSLLYYACKDRGDNRIYIVLRP